MIRRFAPVLSRNKPAMIANVLSLGSLNCVPSLGTYCASMAAAHMMTAWFRDEFKDARISVHGIYPGWINTAIQEEVNADKSSPAAVAMKIVSQLDAGIVSIFPDPLAVKMSASMHPEVLVMPR